MTVQYNIVIPARMASQRLPGKPLLDIGGKPLIEHVHDRACMAAAQTVVIATDDPEILRVAEGFGATAVMTSTAHASGSDRIAECIDFLGWSDDTLVVNLQGDEPLMPPACLDQAANLLAKDAAAAVASLFWPLSSREEVLDPNVVKVVTARDGAALYFSRSPIPYAREPADIGAAMGSGALWNRHMGLYAYRASALRGFTALPPTPLERAEKLEQLRFLESGRRIVMAQAVEYIPTGVDTLEDLQRVQGLLAHSP